MDKISQIIEQGKEGFHTLFPMPHLCPVCGNLKEVEAVQVICNELAEDWRLTDEQRRFFDFREGCNCRHCGSSVRRMHMGMTLLEAVNRGYGSAIQFVRDLPIWPGAVEVKIAEINNCGTLHPFLQELPGLSYSEYGSLQPGVPSEDLMALSYQDDMFDFVLTSDVLEHVPDFRRAMQEIQRILKPGGVFICTVPWLPERQTVIRTGIDPTGSPIHHQSASFHGEYHRKMADHLVFYEFGGDFFEELSRWFQVAIHAHDGYSGVVSSVFSCTKVKGG